MVTDKLNVTHLHATKTNEWQTISLSAVFVGGFWYVEWEVASRFGKFSIIIIKAPHSTEIPVPFHWRNIIYTYIYTTYTPTSGSFTSHYPSVWHISDCETKRRILRAYGLLHLSQSFNPFLRFTQHPNTRLPYQNEKVSVARLRASFLLLSLVFFFLCRFVLLSPAIFIWHAHTWIR